MQYVASISYGKDSLAMLEAIKLLGMPLDRIVHAEVWATDTIQADLPPMVDFKKKADEIIKERYGIDVEHFYATNKDGSKKTYNSVFYREVSAERERERELRNGEKPCVGNIYGFPKQQGAWCNSKLKVDSLQGIRSNQRELVYERVEEQSNKKSITCESEVVQYIGIACDEPLRIERHKGKNNIVMPLVEIGWDEAYCRKWCEEHGLLSPTYNTATRGGCWFCHNQNIEQLRLLRKTYPNLWELLLKWDSDSPVTFKADGHTVHDYDKRFELEEQRIVPSDRTFRWSMLEGDCQVRLF